MTNKQTNKLPFFLIRFSIGWNSKQPGTVYFASELKSLNEECDKIISFPPGHIYNSATKQTTRYLRAILEALIRKRIILTRTQGTFNQCGGILRTCQHAPLIIWL